MDLHPLVDGAYTTATMGCAEYRWMGDSSRLGSMSGFIIANGELPETRPALWLPTRDGYRAEWLQNISIFDVWYRFSRNEGEESVLRKRYTKEMYDPQWLMLREPKAQPHCSTEDLIALGLLGVYGWRKG